MGATSEQMELIDASSMDHVSYILVMLSIACIVFLFANTLVHLYDRLVSAQLVNKNSSVGFEDDSTAENSRIKTTDDFELHGLLSDEEDESKWMLRAEGSGQSFENSSASTAGQNNQARA